MPEKQCHSRLIILGSGPAGYTAAIYSARAMRAPLLISGVQPGGQLTITTDVENYPGFADVIQGPWLVEQMAKQAEHCGAELVSDHIVEVDLKTHPFRLTGDSGMIYTADALVIATGAQAKWLGLESEQAFRGFGVSACATCDGFFYRNKRVTVIGGGNTAVEEALYLANLAAEVVVVHRRDSFRAEKVMQERLFAHPRVKVLWNTVLREVRGTEGPKTLTHLELENIATGQRFEHHTDGLFIAIGHQPATQLFEGQLRLKDSACLWTEAGTTRTSVAGVFAAGDVADDHYRQAVTAAGLGCMAALDAERFLSEMDAGLARSSAQGLVMSA